MVYILESNGVYGLTKGQLSATADRGSTLKGGEVNPLPALDPSTLAIELGCGFVARAFSGAPRQLGTLIRAAMAHSGTALLDVISPCVTFNNHQGSTKSHRSAQARELPLQELDFVPRAEAETVEAPPGEARDVAFPDGSRLRIRPLQEGFDPRDRLGALASGELLTGLLCIDPDQPTLQTTLGLQDAPLAPLDLKPGPELLHALTAELA